MRGMTDIQLAEAYVTENANHILDTNNAFISSHEAFLAGFKAGRLEWHDLRKDPNDIPDNLRYVWTNEGAGHHDDDDGWWDDFGRLHDVIAWCEPKFEEEQDA